jgi:hypothetical protein
VTPLNPQGTFIGADSATPTWQAPLVSTTREFTLQVRVSDNKGGMSQRMVEVQVVNVPAANRPPVLDAAISAPVTVVAGESAALSIGATDPDGDPLTFTWRTNPIPSAGAGVFTNANSAAPRWRSPSIAMATRFTLEVTVSDGTASVTRSATVQVTVPTYTADIQPIWNEVCVSCHDSTTPDGNLNLLPGASYSRLVGVSGSNRCGGTTAIQRVRAGQPNTSLLVRKIEGSCGTRMPQNDPAYFVNNPGLVTLIRSWVLAGAPNN